METTPLSSSLIPRNILLLNSPPSSINSTTSDRRLVITARASSTTFHHLTNKFVTDQTIKNPQFSKKSLFKTIFNALDDFICDFIDLPLHPAVDAAHVLSGRNTAPVDEIPPTACKVVEGVLPSCLEGGAYIRNGPNPQFIPKGPYHFFEGDGMLHMIKIFNGEATFCCRYVKTHKYMMEHEMGYPFVPGIFSAFNGGVLASVARALLTAARVLAGQFDPLNHGFGVANTSLALFSGHLFALCESDLPYEIRVTAEGDIKTLGRHSFGAAEPFLRMTAHPKVDRLTGEAFAYKYDDAPPFLKFFRIDSDGRKQKSVPISSMERCTVIHDFAVTENYAVIPDLQMLVNPSSILRGRSPVEIDLEKVARVGIIPKYAEDEEEMVWIEAAGFNPLHCANAWEEDGGDTVCVVATNASKVDRLLEDIGLADMKLEKWKLNLKTKTAQKLTLSPEFLEFGTINPAYAGKKNRYFYAVIINEDRALGVVKLDLALLNDNDGSDCTVASRRYGLGCHGCEPYFVAREPDNPAAEEDDGYLVAYLHDEDTEETKFVVMDAKSPTLEVIAAVELPQRIPKGFHGLFLSAADLSNLSDLYGRRQPLRQTAK